MAEKYTIELEVDSKNSKKSVDTLAKAIDELSKSVDKFGDESKENIGGVTKESKEAKKGVGLLSTGFKGLGVAMKAAGIGLIVSAFAFLAEGIKSNQVALDAINTVFTTFKVIASQVTGFIIKFYKSIQESTKKFDTLGTVMRNIVNLAIIPMQIAFKNLQKGLISAQIAWENSWLGGGSKYAIKRLNRQLGSINVELSNLEKDFKKSTQAIKNGYKDAGKEVLNFGQNVVKGYTTFFDDVIGLDTSAAKLLADRIVSLKKEAALALANNRLLMQQFDIQAEQQRQIRDDTSKTTKERITANEELGKVLKEQEKLMINNANAVLKAAQAQFELTGNDEDYIAVLNAQAEKAGVLAAIEGKRSEQLVNTVNLQKELQDELIGDKIFVPLLGFVTQEEFDEIVERGKDAADKIAEANKKAAKKEIDDAKTVAEAKKAIRNAELDNIANGVNLLAKLAPKSRALQAAGIIASNAVGIAKIIQSTTAANAGARLKYAAIPAPAGPALIAAEIAANKVSAKIGIATSLIATAKGLAALKSGGSASSSVSLPSEGGGGAQEPQFSIVGQGAGSQIASALGQQPPVQAFVVSQDVTTAQSLENGIIQGATLGG